MSNRYRVARAVGQDRYESVVREDTELLHQFGLRLLHVDCGVRAAVEEEIKVGKNGKEIINPWNVVSIDEKTWNWLHPLLCRLRTLEARSSFAVVPDQAEAPGEEGEALAMEAK